MKRGGSRRRECRRKGLFVVCTSIHYTRGWVVVFKMVFWKKRDGSGIGERKRGERIRIEDGVNRQMKTD